MNALHSMMDPMLSEMGRVLSSTLVRLLVGKLEAGFALKAALTTYEVTGRHAEAMLREVNRILEEQKLTMQNVHRASTDGQSRLIFAVDCGRDERNTLSLRLHESSMFASVAAIGSTEHE